MATKLVSIASTAVLIACVSASGATAQPRHRPLPAEASQYEAVVPSAGSHGYDVYQNPDGSYDSLSNFSRDLEGTPCGMTCTESARARWMSQAR